MRIALNTKSVLMIQISTGWTSGIRLVERIEGGPHAGDSILEGTPKQFEVLYDQLNGSATKLARSAIRVKDAIDRKGAPSGPVGNTGA